MSENNPTFSERLALFNTWCDASFPLGTPDRMYRHNLGAAWHNGYQIGRGCGRASLQEEERVTPPELTDARINYARTAAMAQRHISAAHWTMVEIIDAYRALRDAAPPSEETPQAHPQTLEPQDIENWFEVKRDLVNGPQSRYGDRWILPNGEWSPPQIKSCDDRWLEGRESGFWQCGAKLMRRRPVPPQEPPTPQEVYDSILTRLDALPGEWKTLKQGLVDDAAALKTMAEASR